MNLTNSGLEVILITFSTTLNQPDLSTNRHKCLISSYGCLYCLQHSMILLQLKKIASYQTSPVDILYSSASTAEHWWTILLFSVEIISMSFAENADLQICDMFKQSPCIEHIR